MLFHLGTDEKYGEEKSCCGHLKVEKNGFVVNVFCLVLILGLVAFEWWFQLVVWRLFRWCFVGKKEKMNGIFGSLELDLGFKFGKWVGLLLK